MLGTEHGHGSDDIGAAILGQSFGNNFQGSCNLAIWKLSNSLDVVGFFSELMTDLHFNGTSTRNEVGIKADISCNVDGILKGNTNSFKWVSRLWCLIHNELREKLQFFYKILNPRITHLKDMFDNYFHLISTIVLLACSSKVKKYFFISQNYVR
jgi:hypothetical protein